MLSAGIFEESFSFTEGEPVRVEWPSDVGTQRLGFLCGACGSRIANGMVPSIGVLSLRAGTLHDTSWVRPVAHTWMKSAQPWFRPDPEDLLFDGQPEEYSAIAERFSSLVQFE